MSQATVHIRKEAFIIMVWSAIETSHKECLGFVLGSSPTATRNFYFVTDAVPYQCMKRRSNTEVELSDKASRRFNRWSVQLETSSRLKYLGNFHSHPGWGGFLCEPGTMSECDIEKFIQEGKDGLGLKFIIDVTSRKRGCALWEIVDDGSVKGSLGHYNIRVCAFGQFRNGGEGPSIMKLHIVVPEAIKTLNRMQSKK